jgi:hypothetical protein
MTSQFDRALPELLRAGPTRSWQSRNLAQSDFTWCMRCRTNDGYGD